MEKCNYTGCEDIAKFKLKNGQYCTIHTYKIKPYLSKREKDLIFSQRKIRRIHDLLDETTNQESITRLKQELNRYVTHFNKLSYHYPKRMEA